MMSLRILGYVAWELAVLALACRLAHRVTGQRRLHETGSARLLTLTLVFDIIIGASIATVVTVARLNGPAAYLGVTAAICAALAARPSRLRDELRDLGVAIDRALRTGTLLDRFFMVSLGATALAACFRPIDEWDSLYLLDYLQLLHQNRSALHPTPWHYSMFWELGYLPGMAFTRNDYLFWVTSLKPVLLVAIVLHQIGTRLGLSRSLSALAAVNAVLLCHFWLNTSGVGTLKNDMIHVAGATLLVLGGLRTIRGHLDRETGVLLGAAVIFVTAKYSGLPETAGALGLMALFGGRNLLAHRRLVVRWAGCAGMAWILTTGSYYAWNLYQYRNPLYPFPIKIGPLTLPGPPGIVSGALAGTTILSSIGDLRLWGCFFPLDRVSIAGLWFPFTFAFGLVACASVLARAGLFVSRRRAVDSSQVFVSSILLVFWFIYVRSFFSASARPGDLVYLRDQMNSLRYAEGSVGVSELFLLALLMRTGCAEIVPRFFLVTSMVSRVVLLYLWSEWGSLDAFTYNALFVGPSCFLLLLALGEIRGTRLKVALAIQSLILVLFVFAPRRIEEYRDRYWYCHWKDVWSRLDTLPQGRIFLVYDGKNFSKENYSMYKYVLTRGCFDNDVRGIPEDVLLSGRKKWADYVVYLRMPDRGKAELVREFDRRLPPVGYERISGNEYCSLFREVEQSRVAGAARAKIVK